MTKMNKRGFTIFFAVLVASLALAVGLSIYELLVRELELSRTAAQSQYAIYAADTGSECALYWDFNYSDTDGSAFATTSDYVYGGIGSGVTCNTQDITTQGPYQIDITSGLYDLSCSPSSWCILAGANYATTTFSITFPPEPYCATVEVGKYGNPSRTTVIAHGYNTCDPKGVDRLERALLVTY